MSSSCPFVLPKAALECGGNQEVAIMTLEANNNAKTSESAQVRHAAGPRIVARPQATMARMKS